MKKQLIIVLTVICLSSCRLIRRDHVLNHDDPLSLPGTYPRTLIVDDLERTYLLHIPDCDPGDVPYPLVMMFHGGGGTAKGVLRDTGWSELGDQYCFLVAAPDGIPQDLSQPSSFLNNPQLWNDGSGRFNLEIDDIAFIDGLIEQIQADFLVDLERVYAAGFSNGASMAYRVGIELNDSIAAIAPVSGALWFDHFSLETPVSLLYMTGTDDPLNPLEGGVPQLKTAKNKVEGQLEKPPVEQQIRSWTKVLQCDQTPETLVDFDIVRSVLYQGCDAGSEVIYYTLDGIGHHWPGGKIWLPESAVGKRTDVIQATEVIWNFFSTHPKLLK